MSVVVIVLLALFAAWLISVVGGVLLIRRRLVRLNRVCSDRPSSAPMSWLLAPGQPARFHRRLRNAVRAGRLAIPAPTANDPEVSLPQLRTQLEQQALGLDHQLVIAARLARPHRGRALRRLGPDIAKVEAIVDRLVSLDSRPAHLPRTGWGAEQPEVGLERIGLQVDLIERARMEIDRIERYGNLDVAALDLSGFDTPPDRRT
jgi:hypothetical protein